MKYRKLHQQFVDHRRYSGGWSLMGVLLGAAVLSAVTTGGTLLYNDYKQDLQAQGRAKQLGSGLEQLEVYSRKFHTALASGSSIAGVAVPTAPTIAELRTLGFAATSFADDSQPGGPLLFRIDREPAGCASAKCVLHLTVITSGSVRTSGKIDETLARQIAGYVPNGAGWSNDPGKAHNLLKSGTALPNPLGNTLAVVAAKAWLGNGQTSQTVPPPSYSYRDVSCSSGYSGYREQRRTTTTDKWGNTSTGSWVTVAEHCTKDDPPPVSTPPASSTQPGSSNSSQPPVNNVPGGGTGGSSEDDSDPDGDNNDPDDDPGSDSDDDPPPPPPRVEDPPPPPPDIPPTDPYLEYCSPSKSQFGDWWDDCR